MPAKTRKQPRRSKITYAFTDSFKEDFFEVLEQHGIEAGIRQLATVKREVSALVRKGKLDAEGGPILVNGDDERQQERTKARVEKQLKGPTNVSYIQ